MREKLARPPWPGCQGLALTSKLGALAGIGAIVCYCWHLEGGSGVQPSPAAWASAGKYPFPPPDRCNSAIPRGANDGAGKLSEVRPHGLVGRPPRTRERFPHRQLVLVAAMSLNPVA